MSLLTVKNLNVKIGDKHILKGFDIEVNPGEIHAIMGPNGTGKSTLANVLAGKNSYEIEGNIEFLDKNLFDYTVEERAREGLFLAFQYPVEIPGVSNANFMKTSVNEIRKHRGLESLDAMDFLQLMREKASLVEIDKSFLNRSEMKDFQAERKREMKFSRWQCLNRVLQCSMKPIRVSI